MEHSQQVVTALQKWMEVFMHRSMHRVIRFAKEKNISMSQMGAMFRLRRAGTCSVSDIAEDQGISNAAASQLLERLVQQGMIERVEHSRDRRAKQISLTAKGLHTLQEGIQTREGWLVDLARLLTAEEQLQVQAALIILVERTQQLDDYSPLDCIHLPG